MCASRARNFFFGFFLGGSRSPMWATCEARGPAACRRRCASTCVQARAHGACGTGHARRRAYVAAPTPVRDPPRRGAFPKNKKSMPRQRARPVCPPRLTRAHRLHARPCTHALHTARRSRYDGEPYEGGGRGPRPLRVGIPIGAINTTLKNKYKKGSATRSPHPQVRRTRLYI